MPQHITRNKLTWLLYLMMGYYSYLLNGLGPVMPFLRSELNMSYTVSSLHFSAFAVGILLAGLLTDRLALRFGRRRIFWSGLAGMTAGTLILLFGTHPIVTIGGTFLMGTIGSFLLVLIPSALSEQYGESRAVVISEANVLASFCGGLAPLTLGLFVKFHLSWRGALVTILVLGIVLYLMFSSTTLPKAQRECRSRKHESLKLPGIFWGYWNLLIFAVAVEFCIVFWSATFLEIERGLPKANAALVMSVFLAAMFAGRFLGSRLSQHLRSEQVVLMSVGVSLVGFMIHWWARPLMLTMIGLFTAGIGVANLYPQLLSLAVGTAPRHSDTASARASLASGIAILCLPLLLGGLADRIGIGQAYGLVLILLGLVAAGIWVLQYSPFFVSASNEQ